MKKTCLAKEFYTVVGFGRIENEMFDKVFLELKVSED